MGPQPVNLEEWNITRGILAAECALGVQGYGSYPYKEFPIMLANTKDRVDLRPVSLHPMITEVLPSEMVHVRGEIYMTTVERSIIDLLLVCPENEFVTQALQRIDHYCKLRNMEDKYGVRDILESEIEYAQSAYGEYV